MPAVEIPTPAGTTPGYMAEPASGSGLATIVLQEWWGLEEHIRSVCDRFAAEGFFALAPDLYHGETTTKPSEAQQKLMALSMEQAEAREGQLAVTHVEVLERLPGATLISCRLETGRTHQIRLHLAHAGHSVPFSSWPWLALTR